MWGFKLCDLASLSPKHNRYGISSPVITLRLGTNLQHIFIFSLTSSHWRSRKASLTDCPLNHQEPHIRSWDATSRFLQIINAMILKHRQQLPTRQAHQGHTSLTAKPRSLITIVSLKSKLLTRLISSKTTWIHTIRFLSGSLHPLSSRDSEQNIDCACTVLRLSISHFVRLRKMDATTSALE